MVSSLALKPSTSNTLVFQWTTPNKWTSTAYTYQLVNTLNPTEAYTGALAWPELLASGQPASKEVAGVVPTPQSPGIYQVTVTAANGNADSARISAAFPPGGMLLGEPWAEGDHACCRRGQRLCYAQAECELPCCCYLCNAHAGGPAALPTAPTVAAASGNQLTVGFTDALNPWSAAAGTRYKIRVLEPGEVEKAAVDVDPATAAGCVAVTKTCSLTTTLDPALPGGLGGGTGSPAAVQLWQRVPPHACAASQHSMCRLS